MKAAEDSIKVFLDELSKETAELITEAQAEYEGLYSFIHEYTTSAVCSWLLLKFTFKYFI